MKSLLAISALLAAAFAASLPSSPSLGSEYNGYKVVRIPTAKENHAKVVSLINELKLNTWKFPSKVGAAADVVVSPAQLSAFEKATAGLTLETMHEDLAGSANSTWFNSYHSYDDHLQFLRDLQAQHPSNSEIITSGNSYERRAIQGIHIWGSAGKGKPAIVWHGTIHAREWITTMVVEYLTYNLLTQRNAPDVKSFLDKYDFFIFPITNPDGFVFTQVQNRLWRKNRQPSRNPPGRACVGTDLNRNYPYQWEGRGSSTNPCDETFRGQRPGDAPEVQAHISQMQSVARAQGAKMYIDWHSYSQLFMIPYGYDCNRRASNHELQMSLANTFAEALQKVHGTPFETGPICNTIYPVNGGSVDWAFDVNHFELSFTPELRDKGRYGFVLPADQIVPSGEESWAGIKAMMAKL